MTEAAWLRLDCVCCVSTAHRSEPQRDVLRPRQADRGPV